MISNDADISDTPSIKAGKMREVAAFIDDAMPKFATAVEQLAMVFEGANLLHQHDVGHSAAIASCLREVGDQLPAPSARVADRLREIADDLERFAARLN